MENDIIKTKIISSISTIEISEATLRNLIAKIESYKENYLDRKEFKNKILAYGDHVNFYINIDTDNKQIVDKYDFTSPAIYNEDEK